MPIDDDEKTRRVAEAIRSAVGADVQELSQSLREIAREVNAASSKLAQHEHSMLTAARVGRWIGGPLLAIFCWVLLRGQSSIDEALRNQTAMQVKLEAVLRQIESNNELAKQQHSALVMRVDKIESQRQAQQPTGYSDATRR